jgi:hypothetical protein
VACSSGSLSFVLSAGTVWALTLLFGFASQHGNSTRGDVQASLLVSSVQLVSVALLFVLGLVFGNLVFLVVLGVAALLLVLTRLFHLGIKNSTVS